MVKKPAISHLCLSWVLDCAFFIQLMPSFRDTWIKFWIRSHSKFWYQGELINILRRWSRILKLALVCFDAEHYFDQKHVIKYMRTPMTRSCLLYDVLQGDHKWLQSWIIIIGNRWLHWIVKFRIFCKKSYMQNPIY